MKGMLILDCLAGSNFTWGGESSLTMFVEDCVKKNQVLGRG